MGTEHVGWHLDTTDPAGHWRLSGPLSIRVMGEVDAAFERERCRCTVPSLRLDVSGVQPVDSALWVCLTAWMQRCRSDGEHLTLVGVPDTHAALRHLYGLDGILGGPTKEES